MHTRTIRYAALVGVMVLILPERTLACGWSCRDAAPGLRRPAPSYGYRAYLAQHGRHPFQADESCEPYHRRPRGNTTLDPPGFMSAQGAPLNARHQPWSDPAQPRRLCLRLQSPRGGRPARQAIAVNLLRPARMSVAARIIRRRTNIEAGTGGREETESLQRR